MAIECAFGILVRRWGVFWRPLEVRFGRRAPLIGAAMRLHNYCIDRRIGVELNQRAGCSEIQPRVWMPTPKFDDDGRPIDFLNTGDHSAIPINKTAMRTALQDALRDAGVKRPGEATRAGVLRARGLA